MCRRDFWSTFVTCISDVYSCVRPAFPQPLLHGAKHGKSYITNTSLTIYKDSYYPGTWHAFSDPFLQKHPWLLCACVSTCLCVVAKVRQNGICSILRMWKGEKKKIGLSLLVFIKDCMRIRKTKWFWFGFPYVIVTFEWNGILKYSMEK